jgi:hypothetical protein
MNMAGFFSRRRMGRTPLALAMGALWAMSPAVSAPLIAGPAGQATQQPPVFQSSVEVTSIDATVFDGKGQAPTDLQPSDFAVRISGLPRRVISAQWVPLALAPGKAPAPLPDGYSGNQNMTGGRLIVLAVDQPNIRFGGNLPLVKMLGDFLDRLEPSDRVAAVALGSGVVSTPLTSDREAVKQALARMNGESRPLEQGTHNIGVAEALQFEKHNTASAAGKRAQRLLRGDRHRSPRHRADGARERRADDHQAARAVRDACRDRRAENARAGVRRLSARGRGHGRARARRTRQRGSHRSVHPAAQ